MREFLTEQQFLSMLCLERKRSERSSRPFVLMLIKAERAASGTEHRLTSLARALSQHTRDTDTTGWYKADATLGVMFTELGGAGSGDAVRILSTKFRDLLTSESGQTPQNSLELSFHVYPDDAVTSTAGDHGESAVHPDDVQALDDKRLSRVAKRLIDVGGALLVLILLFPLLLAIAIAVKVTSRGPVLFRQERLGLRRNRFTVLKFRSMYAGNDSTIHRTYVKRLIAGTTAGDETSAREAPLYKLSADPRITPIGRWLRRTSLDELPQLFNVLAGSMSLVGPRPAIPYELDSYAVWHRRRLLTVKPGITGLWQVGGRSRLPFDDMVRLDIRYATSWSLRLDLEILGRTPRAVLSGKGAY